MNTHHLFIRSALASAAVGLGIAFTACDSQEPLSTPATSRAITFGDAFVNNESRADGDATAGVSAANLSLVWVYGYTTLSIDKSNPQLYTAENMCIFNGQELRKNGTSWTYSPAQYWFPDKYYQFVAFATNADPDKRGFLHIAAPTNIDNDSWRNNANVGILPDWYKIFTAGVTPKPTIKTFIPDADGHIPAEGNNPVLDLSNEVVYATQLADTHDTDFATSCPNAVNFNFRHAMAKVQVVFRDEVASQNLKATTAGGETSYTPRFVTAIGGFNPVDATTGASTVPANTVALPLSDTSTPKVTAPVIEGLYRNGSFTFANPATTANPWLPTSVSWSVNQASGTGQGLLTPLDYAETLNTTTSTALEFTYTSPEMFVIPMGAPTLSFCAQVYRHDVKLESTTLRSDDPVTVAAADLPSGLTWTDDQAVVTTTSTEPATTLAPETTVTTTVTYTRSGTAPNYAYTSKTDVVISALPYNVTIPDGEDSVEVEGTETTDAATGAVTQTATLYTRVKDTAGNTTGYQRVEITFISVPGGTRENIPLTAVKSFTADLSTLKDDQGNTFTFQPGCAYRFIIRLTDKDLNKIQFEAASLADWEGTNHKDREIIFSGGTVWPVTPPEGN